MRRENLARLRGELRSPANRDRSRCCRWLAIALLAAGAPLVTLLLDDRSSTVDAAPPRLVDELIKRQVLESLSQAVRTPVAADTRRTTPALWSRRSIIEALDQRAQAATTRSTPATELSAIATPRLPAVAVATVPVAMPGTFRPATVRVAPAPQHGRGVPSHVVTAAAQPIEVDYATRSHANTPLALPPVVAQAAPLATPRELFAPAPLPPLVQQATALVELPAEPTSNASSASVGPTNSASPTWQSTRLTPAGTSSAHGSATDAFNPLRSTPPRSVVEPAVPQWTSSAAAGIHNPLRYPTTTSR